MNIFGYIIIAFTFIMTVVIAIMQPPMHTRVLIYDSQYTIVDENRTSPKETVVETKELPTIAVENNLTQEQRVFQEEVPQTVKTQQVKTVEQPKTTTQTKKSNVVTQKQPTTVKTQKTQPVQKTTQKQTSQTLTQTKPVTQTAKPKTQTKTQQAPVTTVAQQKPVQTVQTQKVLTAQEELIAWNVWHSNLQNQIIKDSKLPILPIGTKFKMNFDVDKYGRVSNVQTWSTDPRYTPYAIEFIAPVIRSYQGKAILEFPKGSARTTTNFSGGFKIGQTSKYSNPSDYHDIERVSR